MKKLAPVVLAALLVAGCASPHYFFDGKRYENRQAFMQAVESTVSSSTSGIEPLPAPVAGRRLVFAFPSAKTIYAANLRIHTATKGTVTPMVEEQADTLANGAVRGGRGFYEAVARRNIYKDTRFVELDSMTSAITPSAEEDVLYWYESGPGAGSWFFASQKHGRQVLAYDRSQPTPAARTKAFVDALQLQAVRD